MNNTCLNCNEPLTGRADKKFCDHFCRNNYNNKNISLADSRIKEINSILRKNRNILKSVNPQGKSTVKKEFLEKLDFNFKYITHIFTTQGGDNYFFCYEFGYKPVNKDKIMIVNWQDYMVAKNYDI